MDLDKLLRNAYRPAVEAQLDPSGPAAALMEQIAANLKAEWDALTPEEQELRTLRARVRELEHIIDHAQRALNGQDCDEY